MKSRQKQLNLFIMKKIFLILFALLLVMVGNASTSFDFYKSIPKYESITLSGQKISITINSNYTVSLSASDSPNSNTRSYLSGSGVVLWDAVESRVYLEIKGTVSGSYHDSKDIYTTERKYNVGSTLANGLFGSGTADYYRTERTYSHTEYYDADGSNSFSCKLPLTITDDGRYRINSQTFSATLTGDVTRTVSFSLNSDTHQINYGNVRTSGNVANDEFGTWQWTKDKSEIYLHAVNIPSDKLVLKRDSSDVAFKLIFSFNKEYVEGHSFTETNIGKHVQLNFAFDDGTNVTLPFLETTDSVYMYATYNRFLEEWNKDATSIIDQIKDKQTIVISYKKNDVSNTTIFELEGLEAILSYLQ